MKRRDLIAQLEQAGCYLIRHGGKHDILNMIAYILKISRLRLPLTIESDASITSLIITVSNHIFKLS